jgi:putative iron-dependent peroxidase
MLEHMFVGDPPGNHDRILDFSTAVTGSLFFVPTADFLDDLPPAPGEAAELPATEGELDARGRTSVATPPTTASEGSLGIAGLRARAD